MLCGIAGGAGTAERPRDQADAIHMTERSQIIHYRSHIVPIRGDGGQLMRITWCAASGDEAGYKPSLLFRREIARIVHCGGARRAAIARGVQCRYLGSRNW